MFGKRKEKTIGIMTVDVPTNLTKEKIDEILGTIQKRMEEETDRLGIDMEWVIMPSIVKTVQTISIKVKKEETK